MGGSSSRDDSNIPEWSFRGSTSKYYFNWLDYIRPRAFGRSFNSEKDVVRYFEERGVRIAGVTVDPDPVLYISRGGCERLLAQYAKNAKWCNPDAGVCQKQFSHKDKQDCIKYHKKYSKDIVKSCGFRIDGLEASQPVRRS